MRRPSLSPPLKGEGRNAPIGLLAGWGRFPILFAEKARQLGLPVVCVGLQGEASAELEPMVDRFYWTGIAKLGRMIRCFKREGVEQIVMAGKFHKVKLNSSFRFSALHPRLAHGLRAWWFQKRKDHKDDTLLLALIDEFARDGMSFASALDFCPELLVKAGILTKRKVRPHPPPRRPTSASAGSWPRRWAGSTSAKAWPCASKRCWRSRRSKAPIRRSCCARCPLSTRRHRRRQSRQAAAGHALRRADHRLRHHRIDAPGRRPRAGGRSRPHHRHRSGPNGRPG